MSKTNLQRSVSGLPPIPATSALVACVQAQAQTRPDRLQAVPPRQAPPVPCRVTGAQVQDAEGRKPNSEGLLYVVSRAGATHKLGVAGASAARSYAAQTEGISGTATIQGGCGRHLEWEIATASESATQKGGSLSRSIPVARPPAKRLPMHFPFGKARLSVCACEGGSREFTILSVAGDSVAVEFKFAEVMSPFKNAYKRAADGAGRAKSEKEKVSGTFSVQQAWKEDGKSHRAYCETEIEVSAEPLLKAEGKFLLYGVRIPKPAEKWLKAGLFFTASLVVKLQSNLVLRLWADDRKWQHKSGSLAGSATATLKPSAELTLVDPEVCSVEIAGQTAFKGTAGLMSEARGVRLQGAWLGLAASVKVSLFDGWVEYSSDGKWFDDLEPLQHDIPMERLFGEAKA